MTVLGDQLTIRPAQAGDQKRVAEIYNARIAERIATFETASRDRGHQELDEDGQPSFVAIDDGQVIGSARAGAYSDRCVYQGVGEHAVYVDPSARGRGSGRTLLIDSAPNHSAVGFTS